MQVAAGTNLGVSAMIPTRISISSSDKTMSKQITDVKEFFVVYDAVTAEILTNYSKNPVYWEWELTISGPKNVTKDIARIRASARFRSELAAKKAALVVYKDWKGNAPVSPRGLLFRVLKVKTYLVPCAHYEMPES